MTGPYNQLVAAPRRPRRQAQERQRQQCRPPVGRVATGSPVAYTTSFTYDAMNRPTGVSWNPAPTATAPGTASSVVFAHSYNKVNQRTGQSVSDNA